MALTRLSKTGRFVIIDGLHVDRTIFETLAGWARARNLNVQDAIQLAVWFLSGLDSFESHSHLERTEER
jgi:hypothetical protein